MSSDPVLVSIEDGVATVTLNRPDIRNAMTRELSKQFIDTLDDLEGSDVRVLVVEGAGSAFCAGGDVNAMVERMTGDMPLAEAVRLIRQRTSRAVERLHDFYLPTVSKIDGVAFGAGANLALAADVQLASADARLSFGFRNVGLAIDSGTSYLLPRRVGENVAKELVFTGEQIGAERALNLGLFNHVYATDEFDKRADEFVQTVADGPTVALRTSKRLIDEGLESSFSQAIANEATAQAAVFETSDHEEGVTAFTEKRDPVFEGF